MYRVATHHSGSRIVVFRTSEHYLDTFDDARHPGTTFIQIVRNGQVIWRTSAPNDYAPEQIIDLMRNGLRPPY